MEQTNERWRPVRGYEGTFLVSDLGRVMNNHGLVLKQHRDSCNNPTVTLKGKPMRVAKAVAHAFVPNPDQLQYQGYKDGNKDNCRADNIEWVVPDFSNDGQARPVLLVKDGEVLEMYSLRMAAKWLDATTQTIKNAANNKERNIRVNGYYIAWSDDTERTNQLLEGFTIIKNLEGEEWRDLPELQGEYQVSNLGRVKRVKGAERLVKLTTQRNGYVYVTLWLDNTTKCFKTSRLVAKAFIPNPDNLPEVDHLNADKQNNTVSNLEWVTGEENRRRADAMNLRNPHRWTDEEKQMLREKSKAHHERKRRGSE